LLSAKGRIRRGELRGFRFSALFASCGSIPFVFPGHVGITALPKKSVRRWHPKHQRRTNATVRHPKHPNGNPLTARLKRAAKFFQG
jgi:hypothetical protein